MDRKNSYYIKSFCGKDHFLIWNEDHHNFGLCFQKSIMCGLAFTFLAVFSAFYIGKQTSYFARNKTQKAIIFIRISVTVLTLLLSCMHSLLLHYYAKVEIFWVDIFSSFVQVFTWAVHLGYLNSLRHYLTRGTRGPRPVIAAWVLTLICVICNAKTVWSINNPIPKKDSAEEFSLLIRRCLVTVQLALQVAYLITLFPHGRLQNQHIRRYSRVDERTPLIDTVYQPYSRFEEVFDPYHLGVAEDAVNSLSYFTFHWVNILMEKGYQRRIESIDDLHDLPPYLRCEVVSQKVQKQMLLNRPLSSDGDNEGTPPKYLLLKALHRCFGKRFYSIGLLKLLSDCLEFAGPLLLHTLVLYVEGTHDIPSYKGYGAGFGLCITSLIGAFSIVHFNYLMAKISIQIRASIISSVYRKVQHLSLSSLSQFSQGEVVNLMSTDTDRVVNMCQSFHAFWSLPIKLGVTLYLLYNQIGLAFLAGVAFAVVLIPINRILAVKIGQLSTRMMHFKDRRINLMNDILSRIREVKLNSWESLFKKKVMDERYSEVKALAGRKYLDAACVYFWASTPVLIPIVTFGTYALMGNSMEPAKVFTAVALFNMLITPLNAFPWVINGLVEAWVSIKRIERLLQTRDYSFNDYYTVVPELGYHQADVQAVIIEGNFTWSVDSKERRGDDGNCSSASQSFTEAQEEEILPKVTLKDINITLKKCQIIGVVGSVGSGKTALLYSLLGELDRLSGVISISGLHQGFGLATQRPWLQNVSIKENILFGQNWDATRFRLVVECCALEEDLNSLPKGEETKCGENGSSLSGGQRARVALARALYQNKSLYILDDIFSSVDGPVARQIMERSVHGLLAGKTVVLVTHHLYLLNRVDWVVHIERGKIVGQGIPGEILPEVRKWRKTEDVDHDHPMVRHQDDEAEEQRRPDSSSGAVPRRKHIQSPVTAKPDEEPDHPTMALEDLPESGAATDETNTEVRSFGELNGAVYTTYLSACGASISVLIFFSLLLMQASRNLVDMWLAKWVSHSQTPLNYSIDDFSSNFGDGNLVATDDPFEFRRAWHYLSSVPTVFTSLLTQVHFDNWFGVELQSSKQERRPPEPEPEPDQDQRYRRLDPTNQSYLIVYIILAATNSVFTLARAFLFAYGGICAARVLHKKLLEAVLHCKMGFFDLNPVGRILNRFSTDVYTIDDTLPFQANILFAQTFGLIGSLIITVYGLPWIILLYIPLMFMYYTIQEYYRHSSRDLRRIYALSLSPLYTHFSDTLHGLPVIRSLRATHRFSLFLDNYLERNQRAQFSLQLSAQWLNLRLQLIGIGILGGVVFLVLWQHHISGVNPGLVGLVISYALTVNGFLNGVITYLTETERELISVERVHQYLEGTTREGQIGVHAAPFTPTPVALPYGWPIQGQIIFENVHLKYHDHNPYSLRDINFVIEPLEKVAFVGRTGAGKSSIFMALFRLVELSRGKIFIDNVDVSDISIKKLRTSLAVVTQDVLLFSGTVRENIDPRSENLDRDILSAIERCDLSSVVEQMGGLGAPLKGGRELSAGEKQLFCLARALLSKAKIVCLDEGTALLDSQTEARVQSVVREAFRNKTVLISSHRMYTIRDCNRVFVLRRGEIAEVGRPTELAEDRNSFFHSIVTS